MLMVYTGARGTPYNFQPGGFFQADPTRTDVPLGGGASAGSAAI